MKEADCYSGKRIGRLTLIEKNRIPSTHGHTVGGWLCRCDCGNEKVIRTYALGLEKGRTQSCGCYQREMTSKRSSSSDGDSRKSSKYFRLYTAWCNMKARCYSEGNDDYQNYGGRGIKVCADWKNNYLSFKDWALKNGFDYRKTSQEQSIDRIDVNGDYRPDNCRWTDLQTQASNKTSNIYVWLDGRRYTQQEIAKKYHMGHKTIAYRINQGWDTEKVIAAAYQNLDSSNQLHITINGETKTLVEWSKVSGVKEPTLRSRYMRGIRGAELIKPANQSLNYHKSMKRIQVDGELFTFSELSKQTGLNEKTLRQRYDKGLRWCDLIAPPGKAPRIVKKEVQTV